MRLARSTMFTILSYFLDDAIHEAVDALTSAQVPVYPVDVSIGVHPMSDEMAEATGGHAYHGNNLKMGLEHATADGSSCYELSYSPSNRKYDGKIRKIRVELADRPATEGYKLSYRRYYFGTDLDGTSGYAKRLADYPDHPRATKLNDPLVAHLEHGAPMAHDLLFRAHIAPTGPPALGTPEQMAALVDEDAYLRARRRNKPVKVPEAVPLQTYSIDYTVLDHAVTTSGRGSASPVMEFGVAAYDADGRLLNGAVQDALRMVPEADSGAAAAHNSTDGAGDAKGLYRLQQDLAVPKGAAWIRVAVRDLATQSVGTLEVPLPVASEPSR